MVSLSVFNLLYINGSRFEHTSIIFILCAYIRPSGIRLCQQQNFVTIDSFALSYLFIKIAYLHCS